MNTDTLFYFVNADGSGHTRRAEAILSHLSIPTVIGSEKPELFAASSSTLTLVKIPSMRAPGDRLLADDVLHVPYGRDRAYLERVRAIAETCLHYRCRLAVIDVCVETALLMRLCGIPYLYMRMSGRRDDAAHLQCYRAATGLIASYPRAFEEPWVPDWMRAKTHYGGGIFVAPEAVQRRALSSRPYILVMRGKGMSQLTSSAIAQAAYHIPEYDWIGIGFDAPQSGSNWQILPYVAEPDAYLQQADIVIANTGNNSVLEVGYWQKPFITLPEWRFFDEQMAKAEQLAQHHLAVVMTDWPNAAIQWRSLIEQAKALSVDGWPTILSDQGARQAAGYISQAFAQLQPDAIGEPPLPPPLMAVQ
ncbi:glycosyltransferase [Oscillatoria sp. CS-180]|uniref:glycosyltransferase n=1 Tax=Oscillatoria sp. CS-180 TaxID=3021720 RepID=UPI00232D5670|nr:glycosyltransferase [Oscillatoria sp. CS-180]MDB9526753.1 glycosyltransferase [Oscillatoria sp. CS-180]